MPIEDEKPQRLDPNPVLKANPGGDAEELIQNRRST